VPSRAAQQEDASVGVDLELLPTYQPGDFGYSPSLLRVDRRQELWDSIEAANPRPVPEGVTLYSYAGRGLTASDDEEKGFGETTEDAYGNPLTYLPAGKLADLFREFNRAEREEDPDHYSRTNRAIEGYLTELPPGLPVILYWC
jgi:hypothetical protein